jgi:phosphoribosylanthranilate isomerase
MTVRVKVCGITRLEDARLAAALGAAAVGFNFWSQSPRCIAPARARRIGEALPAQVDKVGVFVNATLSEIERVAAEAKLSAIQLHGEESPALARALALPVLRAFRRRGQGAEPEMLRYPCAAVLLDASVPAAYGGTGQLADWELAGRVARSRRLILAGGLTPQNLVAAVTSVRPYGVDLNSGVELSPGRKDPDLLRAAFAALSRWGTAPGFGLQLDPLIPGVLA